jgi:hypothetical protein
MSLSNPKWLGHPDNFTMLRKDISTNNIESVALEISEWLGCTTNFIISSFDVHKNSDTDKVQKRCFERHHQRHITVTLVKV